MSPSTDDIRRDDQLLDLLGRRRPVNRDDPAALLLAAWSHEIDAGLPRRATAVRRSGRAVGIVLSLVLTVGGGSIAAAMSGTQVPVLTSVGSALVGWVPGVQPPPAEDDLAKGSTVTMQAARTRAEPVSVVRPPSVRATGERADSADRLAAGALLGLHPPGPTPDTGAVPPPAEGVVGTPEQTSQTSSADRTSQARAPGQSDKATRTVKETVRGRPDKTTPPAATTPPVGTTPPATTSSPGKATPPGGTGPPSTPPGQVDRPDKTRPTGRSGPPQDRGPSASEPVIMP